MIPVLHTFDYRSGTGRRIRKKMLSGIPELNDYIIFYHDEEHTKFWIYDDEAERISELFDVPLHYDSDGNPGVQLIENSINDIQRALNNLGLRYAIKHNELVTAYDFVLPQSCRTIITGTSFYMSDGEREEKYILASDDYQKTILVWRSDDTCETMSVLPHQLRGCIPISLTPR